MGVDAGVNAGAPAETEARAEAERAAAELAELRREFRLRFFNMCDQEFRGLEAALVQRIFEDLAGAGPVDALPPLSDGQLRRLDYYCRRVIDFAAVADLRRQLAAAVFLGPDELGAGLSSVQRRLLAGVCAQRKSFAEAGHELSIGADQARAIFGKALAVVLKALRDGGAARETK